MAQSTKNDTVNRQGLSADDARALCNQLLELATADETQISIQAGRRGFTRSADNRLTTGGGSTDTNVSVTSSFGKRSASVSTNRLGDEALQAAVRRAEDLARLAPENPESMPQLGAQEYDAVDGYYDATGALEPEPRAEAAALAIDAARRAGAVAAGYLDVRSGSRTLANSSGLFAHHPSTGVASTLTVRTPDGSSSGWAGDEAADWGQIESERIASDAVRKCLDWRNKTRLDPGRYTVVLEPTAAGMLMNRMLGAFSARQADEGRSAFAKKGGGNRIGEKLFDERITITSDPASPNAEAAPFDGEGSPRTKVRWVEKGVLASLAASRYWAQKQDIAPLPRAGNLVLEGASDSLEEMIRSTRRGVLITRFWYIRGLNPRILSYTGLTRDGTFLIEDGKIARPVNNFRFNQSLSEMLSKVEMIGPATRVAAGENSSVGTPIVVPALKVRDFNLSSISDAI